MAASPSLSSLCFRVYSAHLSNPNGGRRHPYFANSKPTFLSLPAPRLRFSSSVAFARRKKAGFPAPKTQPSSSSSKFKKAPSSDHGEDDDIDEDAIEALFSQLEEDLKKDGLSDDEGDDEITEEDLARLEQELAEALGDVEFDELPGDSTDRESMDGEESDEEERPPKLKNWQIRRLANALKIGRRKTSIKSLAAELGLERPFVLELLRDPPPYLLIMCASLPDKIVQTPSVPESEPVESLPVLTDDVAETVLTDDVDESKVKVQEPVHVMQTRWSMQKRIKKVQLETLERVYSRTKRPTNAMISSIVHVTNLPWKRVVKWFEDKRVEDGIPDQRVPYRRSMPKTISMN